MDDQVLFIKKRAIVKNDVELTFHKDYIWIYNNGKFPVAIYKLIGCRDIDKVEWDYMDAFNDGIIATAVQETDHFIFEAVDLGGREFRVECNEVIRSDREYEKEDLIDLLKESQRQIERTGDLTKKLKTQIEDLRHYLEKELDINKRKADQAAWLPEDKKQFILGQNALIERVLERLTQKK